MWLVVLWRQLGGRPVIAGFHYLVGVSCDLVYGMRVLFSIFGSMFFFLTGLHFFHVIVGIILIGIILCIISLPQRILPFHLYYNLEHLFYSVYFQY